MSRTPSATLPAPSLGAGFLGAVPVLSDEGLFEAAGVRVMFTGRSGGVSEAPYASLNTGGNVGDDPAAVRANRRLVCEAAGVPVTSLVVPRQVHGCEFVDVLDEGKAASAQDRADSGADGIVIGVARIAALLNSADCLLLAVVSPSGRFALAHAGWRGAVAHIAWKAVRRLADADGLDPASYNVYIGPHIHPECFEVGADVAESLRKEFGDVVLASARQVSLAAAVTQDLLCAGIDPARIADAGICTKCRSDEYYSYRGEDGVCGRQAAFAVASEVRG